jgi:hypothetical protein
MARILLNPKQKNQKHAYLNSSGVRIVFDKDNGYAFSDDSAMDAEIEFFKEQGFVLKGEKKTLADAKPAAPKAKKEDSE